jgi:predicted transcriptional regulator YdeE
MELEQAEPDVVQVEEFTVAGLAHRGPAGDDFDDLWVDFNQRVDDLAAITPGRESYGVIYEYEEGGDEFTHVAGVPVDDTDDLSPELTIVEIPAGPYAVFQTSASDMTDLLTQLHGDWTVDVEYERVMGPMFERYDAGYDSVNRDGTFEFSVPVEAI